MMLLGDIIIAFGSVLIPTSPEYVVITPGRSWSGWLVVRQRGVLGADRRSGRAASSAAGRSASATRSARRPSIVMPLAAGRWWSGPGCRSSVVALMVLAVPVIILARLRETGNKPGEYAHTFARRRLSPERSSDEAGRLARVSRQRDRRGASQGEHPAHLVRVAGHHHPHLSRAEEADLVVLHLDQAGLPAVPRDEVFLLAYRPELPPGSMAVPADPAGTRPTANARCRAGCARGVRRSSAPLDCQVI